MLSLTDSQMNQLQAAAAMLPPGEARQSFIRSVAGRLCERPVIQPTDYAVSRAIQFCLGCRGLATGREVFPTNQENHNDRPRRRSV
jgi:hypothetical protein